MTWGNVHGKIANTPGDGVDPFSIGKFVASTASSIDIIFPPGIEAFTDLMLVVRNIEKVGNAAAGFVAKVSTNGATFETVAGYNYAFTSYSATAALAATGSNGDVIMVFNTAASPFNLATATGKIPGKLTLWLHNITATGRPQVSWEFLFTNSASSPAKTEGWGNFASGPFQGITISTNGVNFSANAELYGVNRQQ